MYTHEYDTHTQVRAHMEINQLQSHKHMHAHFHLAKL